MIIVLDINTLAPMSVRGEGGSLGLKRALSYRELQKSSETGGNFQKLLYYDVVGSSPRTVQTQCRPDHAWEEV